MMNDILSCGGEIAFSIIITSCVWIFIFILVARKIYHVKDKLQSIQSRENDPHLDDMTLESNGNTPVGTDATRTPTINNLSHNTCDNHNNPFSYTNTQLAFPSVNILMPMTSIHSHMALAANNNGNNGNNGKNSNNHQPPKNSGQMNVNRVGKNNELSNSDLTQFYEIIRVSNPTPIVKSNIKTVGNEKTQLQSSKHKGDMENDEKASNDLAKSLNGNDISMEEEESGIIEAYVDSHGKIIFKQISKKQDNRGTLYSNEQSILHGNSQQEQLFYEFLNIHAPPSEVSMPNNNNNNNNNSNDHNCNNKRGKKENKNQITETAESEVVPISGWRKSSLSNKSNNSDLKTHDTNNNEYSNNYTVFINSEFLTTNNNTMYDSDHEPIGITSSNNDIEISKSKSPFTMITSFDQLSEGSILAVRRQTLNNTNTNNYNYNNSNNNNNIDDSENNNINHDIIPYASPMIQSMHSSGSVNQFQTHINHNTSFNSITSINSVNADIILDGQKSPPAPNIPMEMAAKIVLRRIDSNVIQDENNNNNNNIDTNRDGNLQTTPTLTAVSQISQTSQGGQCATELRDMINMSQEVNFHMPDNVSSHTMQTVQNKGNRLALQPLRTQSMKIYSQTNKYKMDQTLNRHKKLHYKHNYNGHNNNGIIKNKHNKKTILNNNNNNNINNSKKNDGHGGKGKKKLRMKKTTSETAVATVVLSPQNTKKKHERKRSSVITGGNNTIDIDKPQMIEMKSSETNNDSNNDEIDNNEIQLQHMNNKMKMLTATTE